MSVVIIGGLYKHYKNKNYVVEGVALHSETLEKVVVYRALYGNCQLWIRPYDMFTEKIMRDGVLIERFKYIGNYNNDRILISVDLPEDVTSTLIHNRINLKDSISECCNNAEFEYINDSEYTGEKGVGFVILASTAGAALVVFAINKVLRTILERPRREVLTEKDANGNVIKETPILLESQRSEQKTSLSFEVSTKSIKISFSDEI